MPHKYEYRDYIEGLDCYSSGGHIPEVFHTLIEPFDGKEAEWQPDGAVRHQFRLRLQLRECEPAYYQDRQRQECEDAVQNKQRIECAPQFFRIILADGNFPDSDDVDAHHREQEEISDDPVDEVYRTDVGNA